MWGALDALRYRAKNEIFHSAFGAHLLSIRPFLRFTCPFSSSGTRHLACCHYASFLVSATTTVQAMSKFMYLIQTGWKRWTSDLPAKIFEVSIFRFRGPSLQKSPHNALKFARRHTCRYVQSYWNEYFWFLVSVTGRSIDFRFALLNTNFQPISKYIWAVQNSHKAEPRILSRFATMIMAIRRRPVQQKTLTARAAPALGRLAPFCRPTEINASSAEV